MERKGYIMSSNTTQQNSGFMGEYIYSDKNQQESSLLMATQMQHSSMKPAKKMSHITQPVMN